MRSNIFCFLVLSLSSIFFNESTGQSIQYEASFIPRNSYQPQTVSWTFDRYVWNEVLFLWPLPSDNQNEETLVTVSNKRLSEIEFRTSLDAWQSKKGDFQYLRLSCSLTESGTFQSLCICTTYFKSKANGQDVETYGTKKDVGWTNQTVSQCTKIPRLSAYMFTGFENVTVLEFDQVQFEDIDADSFRQFSSLELVRLSNDFIPVEKVPFGLLCGFSKPIVIQIYRAYVERNNSGDALFKLLQCSTRDPSNGVDENTFMSILEIENSLLTDLDRKIFSSVDKEFVISLSFPRNRIDRIDNETFFGFTGVTKLDISENRLKSLELLIFSKLSSLKHLDLASNFLEIVDTRVFGNLGFLQTLNLTRNCIHHVSGGFSVIPKLVFLDLAWNRLTEVNDVIVSRCWTLGKLWLHRNQIASIHSDAFRGTAFLKYLDLSYNRLSNETNVKACMQYNLEWLEIVRLNDNDLTWILPFMFKAYSYSARLQAVDLTSNKIEHIEKDALSNQYFLTNILLGNNKLTSLHPDLFKNNRRLASVFLSNNLLETLPESLLPDSVLNLYLASNRITRLPVFAKTMPNLKILNLYGNSLSTVHDDSFSMQFPAIEWLNISNCNLLTISNNAFLNMSRLEGLDISANELNLNFSINYFRNSFKITFLNMSHNNIQSAENLFKYNVRYVSTIDISHNPLISLPVQPKRGEYGQNVILTERLIMKNCSLQKIVPSALELAFFIGLLDLTSNQLTEFEPLQLSDLTNDYQYQILLDGNPIKCSCQMKWLTDDQYSPHYRVSHCYRALTGEFDLFNSIPKDEFLCNVTEYCTVELPQCSCFAESTSSSPTYLDCSNKGIDVFPRNIQVSIKVIHFEGNALTTFTRDMVSNNLTNLEKLFLDYNFITELEPLAFLPFPNIKFLSLSGNRITHLKVRTFWKLRKLEKLYLHNNFIKEMDSLVFDDLRLLSQLTLHSNSLELLKQDTMDELSSLAYLSNLTLDDNPWVCSCDNATFKYWIQQHSEIISYESNITCNGTTILTIPDENLLCYDLKQTILQNKYHAGPIFAVCGLSCLLFLTLILIYRYRYIIQVIIYNKFELRQKQKESESCVYDAITIYDSSDLSVRQWIKDTLIPRLEPKFTLYIPDRDMLPGSVQCNEVVENIKRSRRTLVVLSSAEDKEEIAFGFDVAYHRVRLERCYHRVILILLHNVSCKALLKKQGLNVNFKAYLKTGQYFSVADRLFWQKMLYFLPRSPSPQESESCQDRHM